MSEIVIQIDELSKNYNEIAALKNINLELYKGKIYGLVGPNGAGKTTLMKCINGLINKYEGQVSIFGESFKNNSLFIKKRIGWVSENFEELFSYLKGQEHLKIIGELYGLDKKVINARIEELLNIFDLQSHKDILVDNYSKGLKRRLAISAVLLHNPEIYILDEPYNGLDIRYIKILKKLIQILKNKGKTILISSHILSFTEDLCDEVIILDNGSMIYHDKTENIRDSIKVRLEDNSDVSSLETILDDLVFKGSDIKIPGWI